MRAFIELKEVQGMLEFPELHDAHGFVDRALFLGYLWAKAEVDFQLKPLAMARQAQSRASSAGAKKGVKTRQQQASNKEWRHQLKAFAIDYCAKMQMHPSKRGPSRSKIATEFEGKWVGDEKDLPGHQTIEAEIKLLEENGQLQRLQPLEKLQPKDLR
jgi:hypothetical protein